MVLGAFSNKYIESTNSITLHALTSDFNLLLVTMVTFKLFFLFNLLTDDNNNLLTCFHLLRIVEEKNFWYFIWTLTLFVVQTLSYGFFKRWMCVVHLTILISKEWSVYVVLKLSRNLGQIQHVPPRTTTIQLSQLLVVCF